MRTKMRCNTRIDLNICQSTHFYECSSAAACQPGNQIQTSLSYLPAVLPSVVYYEPFVRLD